MKQMVIVLVATAALTGAAWTQDTMMSAPSQADGSVMMMSANPAPGFANKVMFTDLKAAQMLAAQGPTVLLFSANWCPYCQADLKELDAKGARLGDITVVVVNYDRSADLKRKYGVSYQHTYVQIDAKGDKLALWSGGGIDGVLKNVVPQVAGNR